MCAKARCFFGVKEGCQSLQGGDKRAHYSIESNGSKILEEVLLLECETCCKDNGRQEAVKECLSREFDGFCQACRPYVVVRAEGTDGAGLNARAASLL